MPFQRVTYLRREEFKFLFGPLIPAAVTPSSPPLPPRQGGGSSGSLPSTSGGGGAADCPGGGGGGPPHRCARVRPAADTPDGPLPAPALALPNAARSPARSPAPAFPSPTPAFRGGGPSAECVLDRFQGLTDSKDRGVRQWGPVSHSGQPGAFGRKWSAQSARRCDRAGTAGISAVHAPPRVFVVFGG